MDRLVQSEGVPGLSVDATSPPLAQAAAVALAYLKNTRQANKNLTFAVFAQLARETLERAITGRPTELTAGNLKIAVAPDAAKEPSGWMSPHWKRLTELEKLWQEPLTDTARDMGLAHVPKLSKRADSQSFYSLEPVPLPMGPASSSPASSVPEGGIRYTAEAVAAPAAWLNGALRSGTIRWTMGARSMVLIPIVLVSLVGPLFLWLWFLAGLHMTRPLSLSDILGLVGVGVVIATLASVYRFLDDLFDLRIVMAPSLLTPITADNVTLEFRRSDASDELGELAFVRYTAVCPACDGTVVIDRGRREFPDRLVGRCRRSAREHVYSFDQVLRIGRPLR